MNKYNIFAFENNGNKEQMVIDAHRFQSKYNDDFGSGIYGAAPNAVPTDI